MSSTPETQSTSEIMIDATQTTPAIQRVTKDTKSAEYHEQIQLLREFLLTKKVEGCSIQTIENYHGRILKLIEWAPKDVRELTAKDIRRYLYEYQELRGVSRKTLDGMRLVLSSFYRFLEEEDYILKSPMRKVHKIRFESTVKIPFTDEELERIRRGASNIRDLAIVDLLYSSGMRISELVKINIRDMNFREREVIVMGKGSKERICYFNARTKLEILDYLDSRTDKEEALFVSRRDPIKRIKSGAVQRMLKRISAAEGIPDIHPHRFRRTLATNLLNKGMSLEQVQQILGHQRIETTLVYTVLNKEEVKANHQKFTF